MDQSHPRRFDRKTYNQLTGLDARFLELLDYDCRLQARKSPTGARYSIKPEAWFAKSLGVTRETISHVVTKLTRLGIIDTTHRAPVNGRWQTNLYKIVSWVWWRLRQILKGLRSTSSRVKQGSHLSIPIREKKPLSEVEGGLSGSISDLRSSLKQYAPALFGHLHPNGS